MYKIRIILDTKEDVIRTISFNEEETLEKLHNTITNAFGLNGMEMASFYRTDEEWNQGEEIPLFNMEEENGLSMATSILKDVLQKENDKLLYIYDFLNMWTFFVEVIEISNKKITEPQIILSIGETPTEAPKKDFESYNKKNKLEDDFEDEFGYDDYDDFDDFENYDDNYNY